MPGGTSRCVQTESYLLRYGSLHTGPRQALEVILAHRRCCHGRAIFPADTTHEISDQGPGKNLPDHWLGVVQFDAV